MLLLLICLVLVLFWGYLYIWFVMIRRHINVEVSVNKTIVEIGDPIEVKCIVSNKAQVGCPSLKLRITLPNGLVSNDEQERHYLQITTNLRRKESIAFTLTIRGTERGPQSFENCSVELVLSDGWGLNRHVIQHLISHELIVMPAVLPAHDLALAPSGVVGEVEVRRWLHHDEAMIRGIRAYQYGDPLKYIAWMSSAATGSWMVKEFLSSSESTVHLVLSAQFQQKHWIGTDRETFDVLCSELASVAHELSNKGLQLAFWTNAVWQRDPLRRSFGRQSPSSIRTLLGGLKPIATDPLEKVLSLLLTRPGETSEVIIFANYISEDTQCLIRRTGKHSNIKVYEPVMRQGSMELHANQGELSSSHASIETPVLPNPYKPSDLRMGG